MPNQLFQSIILNIVYTCFHPVEQVNCSRITSTGTCSQKTFKHQKGIHQGTRRNVKKNSKRISCTSYTSDTLGQTAELKTLELLLPRCKLFQKKKKKTQRFKLNREGQRRSERSRNAADGKF